MRPVSSSTGGRRGPPPRRRRKQSGFPRVESSEAPTRELSPEPQATGDPSTWISAVQLLTGALGVLLVAQLLAPSVIPSLTRLLILAVSGEEVGWLPWGIAALPWALTGAVFWLALGAARSVTGRSLVQSPVVSALARGIPRPDAARLACAERPSRLGALPPWRPQACGAAHRMEPGGAGLPLGGGGAHAARWARNPRAPSGRAGRGDGARRGRPAGSSLYPGDHSPRAAAAAGQGGIAGAESARLPAVRWRRADAPTIPRWSGGQRVRPMLGSAARPGAGLHPALDGAGRGRDRIGGRSASDPPAPGRCTARSAARRCATSSCVR